MTGKLLGIIEGGVVILVGLYLLMFLIQAVLGINLPLI